MSRVVVEMLINREGFYYFILTRCVGYVPTQRFHKLDKISNNANIGVRGFTTWKEKIPVTKCYAQWGLNLDLWLTSDSDTLFSELTGICL